jgi:RinA family phage transcriptional activator
MVMPRLNKAYWRYIENELYNYDDTKELIVNLREDIINHTPTKELVPGTGYVSDPTARKATKLVSSKAIARMMTVIKAIDKALARLTDDHRAIFELKYRQALPWQQVCQELPTSERSYFRLRRELILMVAYELGLAESWQD